MHLINIIFSWLLTLFVAVCIIDGVLYYIVPYQTKLKYGKPYYRPGAGMYMYFKKN